MSSSPFTSATATTTTTTSSSSSEDEHNSNACGPRIVITGASSGLGRELALLYARRGGAQLVLAARRLSELQAVAKECEAIDQSCRALVCICDVSDEAACAHLAEFAAKNLRGGAIDALVLNAGIGQRGRVEEVKDVGIYKRLVDVNTLGPVWVTHYCLPLLKAAKPQRGRILVVSSVSGLFGLAGLAGYCMSKAALHGFFEALRNENTVNVTMVAPGFMDTEMPSKNLSATGQAVGETGGALSRGTPWSPEYVARRAVKALDNGQRDVVFDMPIRAALLVKHWIPSTLDRLIRWRFNHPAEPQQQSKL